MKLIRLMATGILLSAFAAVLAQSPSVQHFDKDGLTFDYPTGWQFSDKSSGQMQFLELTQGDVVIRVRSPREWLKSPDKEARAKKLFQDQYVDNFVDQFQQQGMQPKRSPITTTIAGLNADGTRVRAVMGRQSGGLDSFYVIVSDRLVNLSILGSETDINKSAPALDMIRNSLKVTAAPETSPKPSPKPKP